MIGDFIETSQGVAEADPLESSPNLLRVWRVLADAPALQMYLAGLLGHGQSLAAPFVYVAHVTFPLSATSVSTDTQSPFASAVVLWINIQHGDEIKQLCPVAFLDEKAARYAALLRERYGINVLLSRFARSTGNELVVDASLLREGASVHVSEVLRITSNNDQTRGEGVDDFVYEAKILQLLQRRDAVMTDRACVQTPRSATLTLKASGEVGRSGTLLITDSRVLRVAHELGLSGERTLSPIRECRSVHVSLRAGQTSALPALALPPNRLPMFRFACGDPQVPPPYLFRDVTIHGFRLEADLTQLEELCNRYLNEPFADSLVSYKVASPSIIVELLEYGALSTLNPTSLPGLTPDDVEKQNELVFRILVGKKTAEEPQLREARVFCPLIVVDSAWSVTTGREVIGFPKLFGIFDPTTDPGFIWVKAANGDPLIKIKTGADVTLAPAGTGWLWADADLTGSTLDYDDFILPWLTDNGRVYGMVQAKPPVRVGSDVASERIEGSYSIQNLRIALQPESTELQLHPSLAVALGVSSEQQSVPADRWYHARCDFRLDVEDPLG